MTATLPNPEVVITDGAIRVICLWLISIDERLQADQQPHQDQPQRPRKARGQDFTNN